MLIHDLRRLQVLPGNIQLTTGEKLIPRTYIKIEYFQYIELVGSVTIDEFAVKFRLPKNSAAVWLSKWTGRGYLTDNTPKSRRRIGGQLGRPKGGGYKIGPEWWGKLVYGADADFS